MLPRQLVDVVVRKSSDFVEPFGTAVKVGRPVDPIVFREGNLHGELRQRWLVGDGDGDGDGDGWWRGWWATLVVCMTSRGFQATSGHRASFLLSPKPPHLLI